MLCISKSLGTQDGQRNIQKYKNTAIVGEICSFDHEQKHKVMSRCNGRSLATATLLNRKTGNWEKVLFSAGPSDKNLPAIQIVSSPVVQVARWKVLQSNYGTKRHLL